MWPPQLVGLLMSLGGMLVGSLLPQLLAPVAQVPAASSLRADGSGH
jgi:hypothetical protein